MRVGGSALRMVAATALVASLGACTGTGSHDTGTSGTSTGSSSGVSSGHSTVTSGSATVSPYCTKLRSAGQRIQQAEVQLYTSSNGRSAAVNALETELNGLKVGAPAAIKSALTDLGNAFKMAQSLLAHPSSANNSTLAQIGSRLAADAQKVSQYVASKC